jgi:antitoxin (DNA-binding transcriptional repressor) of toxin-antitoxin stability system
VASLPTLPVHDFAKNSSTTVLTKPKCSTYLLYMQTITSRDLVHRSKEIRKLLKAGQTLRWTSHGLPVALIQPASAQVPLAKPDWISRARAAGAVNSNLPSVADILYQDRD